MIIVDWDDVEKTIIRWTLQDGWTWEMYWKAFAQSNHLNEGNKQRVDVIVDATTTHHLPIGALGAFRSLDSRLTDNVRLIVIAGGSSLANAVIQMMARVYRIDSWRVAKSLELAYQLIAADRQKSQVASE